MKKIYLLFALVVATTSCEKDEIKTFPEEKIPPSHQLREIPFKDLPSTLTRLFKDRSTAKSPHGKFSNFFGDINVNVPARKVISAEGEISYTFSLHNRITENSSSRFYFDNLVVYERAEGSPYVYVIRYIPTDHWYETSKDFMDYTGEISFYTPQGDFINKIEMKNGEMSNTTKSNSSLKSSTVCSLEFLGSTTICTNGGSIVGEVNNDEYTCTTTYHYELTCTSSGSGGEYPDDANQEPPEPGSFPSTGGGFTPPTLPEPESKDPCEQMETLENDPVFIGKMNDLKSKTSLNYETGYVIKKEGDKISYTGIAGEADSLGINLSISGTIDGYMHTHYNDPEALSTFSGSDIRTIYELYQNGIIADINTFTISVVTAYDTAYSLKIESMEDFLNFSSNYLNNDANFKSFEQDYYDVFNLYKNWYGEVEAREKALLKTLEGSGMMLFKGNNNFGDWQSIKLDSSSMATINNDCI